MVFRQDTAGYCESDPDGAHDDASIYDVYYSESPLRVKAALYCPESVDSPPTAKVTTFVDSATFGVT